jgi:hypothetical protein
MSTDELHALREGDCIQSKLTGQTYLVTGNYGMHVTAVCTVDVTHASEWTLVSRVIHRGETPQEDTP